MSIANATALTEKMASVFSKIEDPRVKTTRVHLLADILIIAILSVIAGAKGWEDMEHYGLSKYESLEEFLALPEGIPSEDTFRRFFERINPKRFRSACHHLDGTNLSNVVIGFRVGCRNPDFSINRGSHCSRMINLNFVSRFLYTIVTG
jgi:hypothetical protein